MEIPQFYEGTIDEIVEQIRNSNLTGKLKAIIMPDNDSVVSSDGETLDVALAALIEEAQHIQYEVPVPPTASHKQAFAEIMDEKYRKMGFNL